MTRSNFDSLQKLFHCLSDVTRLRLLEMMCGGERSVSEFVESLKEPQPKISRHLATLRDDGLVMTRRNGKNIYYAIDLGGNADTASILIAVLQVLSGKDVLIPLDNEYDISGKADIMDEPKEIQTIESRDELPIFLL